MLQLPNPVHCGLQESFLLHHTSVDCFIVLTAVELLVLDKDKTVVEVIQGMYVLVTLKSLPQLTL